MRGEGEFFGARAYDQLKALASLFYEESPGVLLHPVWQSATAYLVELKLLEEPRAEYIRYGFVFWECDGSHSQAIALRKAPSGSTNTGTSSNAVQYYTVQRGDTLWAIAQKQGVTLSALLALNPQIKNPNRIAIGEQVRVA